MQQALQRLSLLLCMVTILNQKAQLALELLHALGVAKKKPGDIIDMNVDEGATSRRQIKPRVLGSSCCDLAG